MKAHIVKISPAELEAVFPLIGEFIMRGIRQSDGRLDVDSFCKLVADGDWLLWGVYVTEGDGPPVFKAVVASSINETPSGQIEASVPFLGGADREQWVFETLAFLEAWAEAEGAVRMHIMARRGLSKALESYRIKNVILEKKLGDKDHGRPIRTRRADCHDGHHANA